MLCRRRSRNRGSEPRRRPAGSRQRRRSRLPRLPLPRRSGPAAKCSRRVPGAALVRAGVSPRARRPARRPSRTRYTRREARGTGTGPVRTTRRCGPRRARQRGCRRRRPIRRATTLEMVRRSLHRAEGARGVGRQSAVQTRVYLMADELGALAGELIERLMPRVERQDDDVVRRCLRLRGPWLADLLEERVGLRQLHDAGDGDDQVVEPWPSDVND